MSLSIVSFIGKFCIFVFVLHTKGVQSFYSVSENPDAHTIQLYCTIYVHMYVRYDVYICKENLVFLLCILYGTIYLSIF